LALQSWEKKGQTVFAAGGQDVGKMRGEELKAESGKLKSGRSH
jgi:hypothetical protein